MFFFFFFDEVESFLQESIDLTRGEFYEKEKSFGAYKIDFFLPKGCVKWNYPPNTAIEVVNSLKAGKIYQVNRYIEAIRQENYDIKAYYIFCKDIPESEHLPLRSPKSSNNIIHVVDFNTLRVQKKPLLQEDDYWQDRQIQIRSKAKSDFAIGKNTLFLGAGLSISCGLPCWDELLELLLVSLRKKKALSVNDIEACRNDSQKDLLVKARYIKQFYAETKNSLASAIREALYKHVDDTGQLLKSVANLIKTGGVESIITYNYDDLLEEVLKRNKIPFSPIDRSNRPELGTLPILHTHGFIPREEDSDYERNVVLSEEDYHSLYRNAFHWANVEQLHALTQTICYFIGLSLKDPSLRRLLDISFERSSGNAVHYAFLPRNDYKQPAKAETIFYNMGVNIIWYENVDELPSIVDSLAN
jgi:hypothetical protein